MLLSSYFMGRVCIIFMVWFMIHMCVTFMTVQHFQLISQSIAVFRNMLFLFLSKMIADFPIAESFFEKQLVPALKNTYEECNARSFDCSTYRNYVALENAFFAFPPTHARRDEQVVGIM